MTETELVIRRVVDAAVGLIGGKDADKDTQALLAALDAAMSHAYAEGRADQAADEKEARWELAEREREDRKEAEFEKAARLMNETGLGEHMGLK